MNLQRQHASHRDIVKRLKRAHGHLASVIAMIEAGRSCVDLAQQLHAVESAIAVDAALPLADALAIATALQNELAAHMPELAVANVRFGGHRAGAPSGAILRHHAPEPQGHHHWRWWRRSARLFGGGFFPPPSLLHSWQVSGKTLCGCVWRIADLALWDAERG